jgi:hypothetical protein
MVRMKGENYNMNKHYAQGFIDKCASKGLSQQQTKQAMSRWMSMLEGGKLSPNSLNSLAQNADYTGGREIINSKVHPPDNLVKHIIRQGLASKGTDLLAKKETISKLNPMQLMKLLKNIA